MTGTALFLTALTSFMGFAIGHEIGKQRDERAAELDAAEAAEHEAYWGPIRAVFAEVDAPQVQAGAA